MMSDNAVRADARWYVVQCKPNQSFRAEDNLRNQGYECFHPLVHVDRIKNGRRCVIEESLFSGYLFVHLDSQLDNWAPIRSTRGVSRVVAFNGRPVPVSDELIGEIRERVSEPIRLAGFREGDPVRLVSGAFSGLDAVFQSFDGEERAMILLTLMQSPRSIVVPVGCIQRV